MPKNQPEQPICVSIYLERSDDIRLDGARLFYATADAAKAAFSAAVTAALPPQRSRRHGPHSRRRQPDPTDTPTEGTTT